LTHFALDFHSPQFYSPNPSKIFSGIIVATSQLWGRDRDIIAAAVQTFGGQFRRSLTPDVTHLVLLRPEGVCIIGYKNIYSLH